MPDLSPKQLAVWLVIAALVLFIGARALRETPATRIEAGLQPAGRSAGGGAAGGDLLEIGEEPDPGSERSGEPAIYVHVAGAVRRPDVYRLAARSRVADAIRRAGGATARADLDQVNLAAALVDGQQVRVPRRDGPAAESSVKAGGAAATGATAADPSAAAGAAPISLAGATAEDLETIDGIGPVTAAKIIAFRDAQGGVASIEELDAVSGIGPVTMQSLRDALVP